MLDVEVLGWCGFTWSAVVWLVGCIPKFWEMPLETAYGREMNIHKQQLWRTFLWLACQLHAPSKLVTSVTLGCVTQQVSCGAIVSVSFYCGFHLVYVNFYF